MEVNVSIFILSINNSVHFTGRLNVVNLHGGSSAGSVGLSFGTAMRIPYKHTVLPVFGEFLKLCFGVLHFFMNHPEPKTFPQGRKSVNNVLCQSMDRDFGSCGSLWNICGCFVFCFWSQ